MTTPIEIALDLRRTRSGKQPRIPRAPKQAIGLGLEREYQSALRKLITPARKLIDKLLLPELARIGRMAGVGVREDSERADVEPWADAVAAIMQDIRAQYDATTAGQIQPLVQRMGSQSNAFNAQEVRKQIGAMIGIDLVAEVPGLAEMLQAWTVDNVGLIKSISARYFEEIEGMVLRSFNAGIRAEELAPQILERFGVSESRANLIARDQISKLQGDLTRKRQTQLGVKKYRWRTAQDERVRSSHRSLNNRVFSWNNPPVTNSKGDRNHPGGDYQCRCTADPIIGDLLD